MSRNYVIVLEVCKPLAEEDRKLLSSILISLRARRTGVAKSGLLRRPEDHILA